MPGVDKVNYTVVSGRLAPALVTPVATGIGKHARKVTNSSYPRSRKAGACEGIDPSITTVG